MADWPPLHDYSRSRAVLMGTWDYEFLGQVPAAENSLHRMTRLLSGPLCGWPRERLLLVENEHSPGDLPDRLITAFDGVRDVALFYFVGHGQIAPDDQLCLALARSRPDPNRRTATSLRFSDVRQALNDCGAATKIVILDCCFAGLATAGTLAGLAGDVLDLTAGTGAYTLAATSAYATAWYEDGPGLVRPQTYFTKYLADLVEAGVPRQPSRLRLDVLYKQLRNALASDQRPVPSRRAVDDAREFVFAYNAAPPQSHRDPEQELTQLHARLIESEGLRAEASAQIRALQSRADELARELARLQDLESGMQPRNAAQERQLREAIGEAAQQLADTQAEQAAMTLPQESAESRPERTAPGEGTAAPSDLPGRTARTGEQVLRAQVPEHAEEAENPKAGAPGASNSAQEEQLVPESTISTTERPLGDSAAADTAVPDDDSRSAPAPPGALPQPVPSGRHRRQGMPRGEPGIPSFSRPDPVPATSGPPPHEAAAVTPAPPPPGKKTDTAPLPTIPPAPDPQPVDFPRPAQELAQATQSEADSPAADGDASRQTGHGISRLAALTTRVLKAAEVASGSLRRRRHYPYDDEDDEYGEEFVIRRWPIVTAALVLLVLLLGAGSYGFWQYNQSQFYVGIDSNGNVAIYRGTNQSILGINLSSLYSESSLKASMLTTNDQAALTQTISQSSVDSAHQKINQLAGEARQCQQTYQELAAWRSENAAYQSYLTAKQAAAVNHAHSPAVVANPGAMPAQPDGGTCAPSTVFGVPASALPGG